jgi:hypothetical protein
MVVNGAAFGAERRVFELDEPARVLDWSYADDGGSALFHSRDSPGSSHEMHLTDLSGVEPGVPTLIEPDIGELSYWMRGSIRIRICSGWRSWSRSRCSTFGGGAGVLEG